VTAAQRQAEAAKPQDAQLGDRELAERVHSRGDAAAFRELYRRHTTSLYAIARRLGGDAEAEDIVHDAWVRAVEGLSRFEWRSSLRTWLTGIVINRLRELDRGEHNIVPLDEQSTPIVPAVALPHGIEPIDLERAIAALPFGYRQVLVLHDVEGYTHADIAALLGIEQGTSKSQLSRARRSLRSALEREP
jgi:RNA polymerase sigma-70 factor, ECF subfamily